ncbi:MAB_1171c family putative transporter [Streptomyces huasconensis]|uniref:MAB_1171c family putative transporter n=1 Tax=Streptomyces huasconensis TaxID=1854574 RepID=UPI0033FAB858
MSHQLLVAILLWAVALWRLPSLSHSRKQRALEVAFVSLAAAMTFEVAPVERWTDALTGAPSTAYLLKHLLGVVSAAAVLDFVIAVVRPLGLLPRPRWAVRAAALFLLTVTFLLAPHDRRAPEGFLVDQRNSNWALLHLGVFTLYIGIAMAVAAWLFIQAARHTPDRWVRAGHGLLGVGCAIGLLYALQRTAYLWCMASGQPTAAQAHSAAHTSTVLKVAAIITITVGSCLPPLSPVVKTTGQRRALAALDPLWRGLTAAVPSVVLETEIAEGRWGLRLNRCLIEIADASLALREYVPADMQARAEAMAASTGAKGERQAAIAEAGWLRAAAEIAAVSRPCAGDHPELGGVGKDPGAELRWLRWVSAAYDRSSAVAAFATAEAARAGTQDDLEPSAP